jgi:hypothetical protein
MYRIKNIFISVVLVSMAFGSINSLSKEREAAPYAHITTQEEEGEITYATLKWMAEKAEDQKEILVRIFEDLKSAPKVKLYLGRLAKAFPGIKFKEYSEKARVSLAKKSKNSLRMSLNTICSGGGITWIDKDVVKISVIVYYGLIDLPV